VVFRVGATDAEELVKEFTPVFIEEDLVNLPKFEFYIKLMIDGIASDPFSARGLAPFSKEEKTNNKEKAIKISRERYAKKKEIVEEKISRWHANEEHPLMAQKIKKTYASNPVSPVKTESFNNIKEKNNIATAFARDKESIYKFEATCSNCGKLTNLPFKPDGVRPIFCKDCLSLMRQKKQQNIESKNVVKKEELLELNDKKQEISLRKVFGNQPINFLGQKTGKTKSEVSDKKQDFPKDKEINLI